VNGKHNQVLISGFSLKSLGIQKCSFAFLDSFTDSEANAVTVYQQHHSLRKQNLQTTRKY